MVTRNVPLAQQVILEILSEIDSGAIAGDSGLLPSEAELSQRFQVSRATVREALARLEFAGVIIRRQGIGTYVNRLVNHRPASVQYWFGQAEGFSDLIRASGHKASCAVLETCVRRAGDLAGPLSIGADEPVFAAKRLFSATSAPVIYSINVIPVALIEPGTRALLESGYSYTESTYEFLQRKCNQKVHHQRSAVRAVPADEQLARTLNCQAGDALLCLEEVGYSSDLTPLFYALNHFPGSAVSLLLERAPAFNITGPSAARSLRATSGEEI